MKVKRIRGGKGESKGVQQFSLRGVEQEVDGYVAMLVDQHKGARCRMSVEGEAGRKVVRIQWPQAERE